MKSFELMSCCAALERLEEHSCQGRGGEGKEVEGRGRREGRGKGIGGEGRGGNSLAQHS